MNRLLSLAFVLALSYSTSFAQTNDDEPLLPQNNEYTEEFAEKLMESFNLEELEEQMLQLAEQLNGYSNGMNNEPHEWIDSLKNGMMDGKGFFFLDPNGGDNLGMQFGQMQEMLRPMLDSMMNGGMMGGGIFDQFNFGDMGDMGQMFDMSKLFGQDMDLGDLGNFGNSSKMTFADKLEAEMWKDDLLQEEDINKVEITGKDLKINGQKQSKAIFEKYRDMFELSQGYSLTHDSIIKLNLGNEKPQQQKRSTKRI